MLPQPPPTGCNTRPGSPVFARSAACRLPPRHPRIAPSAQLVPTGGLACAGAATDLEAVHSPVRQPPHLSAPRRISPLRSNGVRSAGCGAAPLPPLGLPPYRQDVRQAAAGVKAQELCPGPSANWIMVAMVGPWGQRLCLFGVRGRRSACERAAARGRERPAGVRSSPSGTVGARVARPKPWRPADGLPAAPRFGRRSERSIQGPRGGRLPQLAGQARGRGAISSTAPSSLRRSLMRFGFSSNHSSSPLPGRRSWHSSAMVAARPCCASALNQARAPRA